MNASAATRALLAASVLPAAFFGGAPAQADEALWAKLAEGGKVVLMRHAAVVTGRHGGNSLVRDPSCKKERNLSEAGKRQAITIGESFGLRNIRIEAVHHSPYCRAATTAKLAFGGGSAAAYLSLLEGLSADAAAARTAELSRVIGSYSGKGNLVLVTHEPNINAVSFEMMKPADFLVLHPKGGSAFEELGIVKAAVAD